MEVIHYNQIRRQEPFAYTPLAAACRSRFDSSKLVLTWSITARRGKQMFVVDIVLLLMSLSAASLSTLYLGEATMWVATS